MPTPRFLQLLFFMAPLCLLPTGARAQLTFGSGLNPVNLRQASNGMAIIVQEDHRVPRVSLSLRYEGGEVAAPPGLEAVAQLTTDLMTYATKHVPKGEYTRLLARAGATGADARAWTNGIILQASVPANRLALPLWLWSDEMAYFDDALEDAAIVAKKGELREQVRGAVDGEPLSHLDELADQELYPEGHPYRRQQVLPESVDHVDRAAIIAFHDTWITPAHATLTIVGDVTLDKAVDLVEHYFGTLPHGSSERVVPPALKKIDGEVQIDVAANVPNAEVSIRWPTPRQLSVEDARLDVLARCLKGDRTAWLFWKLVDEKKVARGVRARQRSGAWASEFDVTINGAPGHSAAEILSAFDTAMDEVDKQGVSQGSIDGAAYEETVDRLYAYESSSTRASEYGKFWALAGNADYASRDFARYTGITPEIVKETLERWVPRNRRVALLVSPDPSASTAGDKKARRFTPVSKP